VLGDLCGSLYAANVGVGREILRGEFVRPRPQGCSGMYQLLLFPQLSEVAVQAAIWEVIPLGGDRCWIHC
jgi:hypothetical protein